MSGATRWKRRCKSRWLRRCGTPAARGHHHGRIGVPAGAQREPRSCVGVHAVANDLLPIHEHVIDAVSVGVDARFVAGQIRAHMHGSGSHRRGIEHHNVRVPPGAQHAAFAQAEQFRRHLRELMDGLWQRHGLEFTDAVAEHLRGERNRVDHVEVGAGVGCADHGAVVRPELAAYFPQRFVTTDGRRHEGSAKAFGDGEVEHRVDRRLAEFARDRTDRPPLQMAVGGVGDRMHGELCPIRQAAQRSG